MRRHVKASSGGFILRQAPGFDRNFGGTPISRALSVAGKGTPFTRLRGSLASLLGVLLTAGLLAPLASAAAPGVETVGAPVRTTTAAQLNGRVNPAGIATTYHFEYGPTGSYGESTSSQPAGSGNLVELVSEEVTGLQPDTTYHYRLVADNGTVAQGEDMTLTTRASNAAFTHGRFPGPPGSDRAWELVSAPDSGGNPVSAGAGYSDDGNRAYYNVRGGTPDSVAGSLYTKLFAERTSTGWKTKRNFPNRAQANASIWNEPEGRRDLAETVAFNFSFTGSEPSSWRLFPDHPATKVFSIPNSEWGGFTTVSEDASRVVWALKGPQDPAHPAPSGINQFYDVTTGSPEIISLLPDGSVPLCGVTGWASVIQLSGKRGWVSSDGSLAFFDTRGNNCGDSEQLYVRDIEAGTTTRMSSTPISGPECDAYFIKSTPGTAYFWTTSRLVASDSEPAGCTGGGNLSLTADGDVYRYDTGDGSLQCVTCLVPGVDADVQLNSSNSPNREIGVADDGSRIYFRSSHSLLSGGDPEGGVYVVRLPAEELLYVGGLGLLPGDTGSNALNSDGSVFAFRASTASLNPLGGQSNGGTAQFYRYDDRDRSLLCVSCPQDGSAPVGEVLPAKLVAAEEQQSPNTTPLDNAGDFIFSTSTPLYPADQNTAPAHPNNGLDVYEWRDGRLLLVSDGLTNWPVQSGFESNVEGPRAAGITPSGHDVFFTAPTQYTADALDGYTRIYDARQGGGFSFPAPPKPCPLEVCQGIPKGAPEELPPGTRTFTGSEGPHAKQKPKKHRNVRTHKKRGKKHHHRASNNRRTGR